jgi:drug/metabolite transporter (DMT)-like permease
VLPVAAAAGTGILVGTGIVATRSVIDETTPISLAFLRYLIGAACLVPVVLMTRWVRFERRDLLPISLLGIIQFGVLIALLNYGLQTIPAARGALLFATMPLFTMLVGALLRYESLTVPKTLGVLLTIAGVAVAAGENVLHGGSGSSDSRIGQLAVLASALSGGICSVLYRPYLRKYPPLQVSVVAMIASVGFLAILVAREGFFRTVPHFSSGGWVAVIFIGMSSAVGYFLLLWALTHTSPTRVTVFLALGPITAAVLGALLLDEPLTTAAGAGLVCVVLGIWFANWTRRAAPGVQALAEELTPPARSA